MPKAAKKAAAVDGAESTVRVTVPEMKLKTIRIRLVGDSPLICHKWSEKAKKEILDKQMKKAKQAKEAKDPEQLYRESLYEIPGGKYGFPAVAFKAAAVGACRFAEMKMTEARGAFHVVGELVPIEGQPSMREDMVRIAMGTADIRYRGEFKEWSAEISIRYNTAAITPEQLVNLFNIAGFAIGIGEWRPERNGSYGMFHVE